MLGSSPWRYQPATAAKPCSERLDLTLKTRGAGPGGGRSGSGKTTFGWS